MIAAGVARARIMDGAQTRHKHSSHLVHTEPERRNVTSDCVTQIMQTNVAKQCVHTAS